jgi:hypothetical protein
MDPSTAPRTLTGNGGSELLLAAAGAAIVVDAGTGEVSAGVVGAADEDDESSPVVVGIEAVPSVFCSARDKNWVALTHIFFLARNMHKTSFSFPPDITTSPLWSFAIE